MKGYFYKVSKEQFCLSFINDSNQNRDPFSDKWPHYKILNKVIRFMRDRGFEIKHDTSVGPTIRKDYWYGKKENLECSLERYPRGFSIKFFQNINFKNPNGGQYDSNKYWKAPYLIKLSWINETKKIGNFLETLGIKNCSDTMYKLAEDRIKKHFVDSWHHPQKHMNFALSILDGTTCSDKNNNTDRDGKTIHNGDIKYFRDYNGRLMRGKVYHNINNMWWVILNDTKYTNIATFDLFDANESDIKVRRKVKDRKPKEYLEKVRSLESLTNKELFRELKKRGIKVS